MNLGIYVIIPKKKKPDAVIKVDKMQNHFILSWEFGPQKIFPNPKTLLYYYFFFNLRILVIVPKVLIVCTNFIVRLSKLLDLMC